MPNYNIYHTDINIAPEEVDEGSVNTTSLDIALFGRVRLEYGERLDQNLLNLLENFSSDSDPGIVDDVEDLLPAQPLLSTVTVGLLQAPTNGQIWHNASNNHLYIWDAPNTAWIPLSNRADYAGNWGQVTNGQQIPKPIGADGHVFEYNECIYSTSLAEVDKFQSFVCFADAAGYVTVEYSPIGSSDFIDGIANYIIIGIRGNVNQGNTSPPPIPGITPTPTPTPTPSISVTPSITPSASHGSTPTPTPSHTPTPTPTPSPAVPMTVRFDDGYGNDGLDTIQAICFQGASGTGYSGCSATTITPCGGGASPNCAPSPGTGESETTAEQLVVIVTGGTAPYTVKLQNSINESSNDLQNAGFESSGGWTLASGTGSFSILHSDFGALTGTGYGQYDGSNVSAIIINNVRAPITSPRFPTQITATCNINQWGNGAHSAGGYVLIAYYDSGMSLITTGDHGNLVDSTSDSAWGVSSVSSTPPSNAVYASVGVYLFRTSSSSSKLSIDDVSWNIGNAGTPECFFIAGQGITAGGIRSGIFKTYSLPTSGSSTTPITINGICASNIFQSTGTFDVLVTDSASASQLYTKNWQIQRVFNQFQPGNPDCVTIDSIIHGFDGIAGDVTVGNLMTTIDHNDYVLEYNEITRAKISEQVCVRIITENDTMLECSHSAPIANKNGEQILASRLLNQTVPIWDNGKIVFEKVAIVEPIGIKAVINITCGDKFFLAGSQKNKYFLHHNKNIN